TGWLAGQPWVAANPLGGLWEPRSLQAYALGLALISGLAVAARIGLRRTVTGRELLLPAWPGVDRGLLGLLVVGQLGLVDWAVLRDVLTEVLPQGINWPSAWWPDTYAEAYGPGAWLLQAALGAVLLLSLWQPPPGRRQTEAILGMAIWFLVLPTLVAGGFARERAAASALRWALAAALLAGSLPIWLRYGLATVAGRVGMHV